MKSVTFKAKSFKEKIVEKFDKFKNITLPRLISRVKCVFGKCECRGKCRYK